MAVKKLKKSPKSKKKSTGDPCADLASEVVKQYAARQKIRIELTKDQMEAILKQWNDKNPLMPAEVTFYAGRRPMVNIKLAGYRYRGDTCCA